MERSPSSSPSNTTSSPSSRYVSWDEVAVYRDGGNRVFHYYLKRPGGRADLAVVGKEKMPYRLVLRRRSMAGLGDPAIVAKKLRTRRDVIYWLNSVISGPGLQDRLADDILQSNLDADSCMLPLRDSQWLKRSNSSEGFLWIGLPWTCKKMLRHYPSFRRRGIKISIHDFVYVLSEDNKRLVAYIEDMYEDSQGSKMVVVRWFHKVDEVGLVLSRAYSDREVFFSLCLQDLNIECIDGIATVLGPYHFEKYKNQMCSGQMKLFMCHELFDDDEIKPFDITRVKGYWNQQIFKHMFPPLPPKPHSKPQPYESSEEEKQEADQDSMAIRPGKKRRLVLANTAEKPCTLNEEKLTKEDPPLLSVGSAVEVLSQDSGLRGCWFRASIIKVSKDKNKVKVRYQDIVDAIDETSKLEEWVSASRLASPDELGVRFNGRRTIRPSLRSNKEESLHVIGVGTAVDAWWHDGWWEGIVVQEEQEGRLVIFFPGEKQEAVFALSDLRHSQEWIGNKWVLVKERPEVVTSIDHLLQKKHIRKASEISDVGLEKPHSDPKDAIIAKAHSFQDTCENIPPANLKWKSSGKRSCRRRKVFFKSHQESETPSSEYIQKSARDKFQICPSFKVDREQCKFISDSPFTCSAVPSLSNLVMSR